MPADVGVALSEGVDVAFGEGVSDGVDEKLGVRLLVGVVVVVPLQAAATATATATARRRLFMV